MPKHKEVKPDPVVAALSNLGHRIERLESREVSEAATKISDLNIPIASKASPPMNGIENASMRLLGIIGHIRRASFVAYEIANAVDGGQPSATDIAGLSGNDRPPLHATISMLEREVDGLFDQLGRIHPNPRS